VSIAPSPHHWAPLRTLPIHPPTQHAGPHSCYSLLQEHVAKHTRHHPRNTNGGSSPSTGHKPSPVGCTTETTHISPRLTLPSPTRERESSVERGPLHSQPLQASTSRTSHVWRTGLNQLLRRCQADDGVLQLEGWGRVQGRHVSIIRRLLRGGVSPSINAPLLAGLSPLVGTICPSEGRCQGVGSYSHID